MIIASRPSAYDRMPYAERMALMAIRADRWKAFSFKGWSVL